MKKWILVLLMTIGTLSNGHAQEPDSLKAEDILKMSLDDLMNTQIISASKIRQQIKEVAATVQVITAEQIKERAYFTLEEALSDLPGFQFRNIVGYNSYVFMRGAPSQNNLILLLVDGIQINELNSGGFYAGGQFNLSEVERIEVVYGPASALYGTNAVSGIINIITKDPEGGKAGHISLLGGDYNTGMVDFSFRNFNEAKNIGFSLSGMYKTSEKADLGGAKGDGNWSDGMENYENDLSLSAKVKTKNLTAGIVYQDKKSSLTTSYKSVGSNFLDKNTLWNISFLNGYLKYEKTLSEKISLNSMLYYRNATVNPNSIGDVIKATDTSAGSQIGYYRPNALIGTENQINYKAGKRWMLIGGVIGEMEWLSEQFSTASSLSEDRVPPEPPKPEMLDNYLFSYYAQAEYAISDDLCFTGGLRHDISSYYGQVLTPRTGLVFNKNKVTAKLLYNRAFRAPKPWDYKYGIGNGGLNPEKMHSFELDFSYLIMNHLSLGASVYRNLIDDKLTREISQYGNRWINKNELSTFGYELYTNYSLEKLQVYANYTYSDSYDQDEVFIPEISMHTANAGFTYSWSKHIKINLRANYLGQRKNPLTIPNTGNNIIDNAVILNGCLSFLNINGLDFQLKINNMLDHEYYHPSNLFAGRYRQPQRTFALKINYNF